MRFARSALTVALLVGAGFWAAQAAAQAINLMPQVQSKSPEERERERRIDEAYRARLRSIPDAQTAVDPWGSVRGAPSKSAPPAARGAPRDVDWSELNRRP